MTVCTRSDITLSGGGVGGGPPSAPRSTEMDLRPLATASKRHHDWAEGGATAPVTASQHGPKMPRLISRCSVCEVVVPNAHTKLLPLSPAGSARALPS